MNRQDLLRALDQESVPSDVYDLNGGLLPERLTIAMADGKWLVYYSERGRKKSLGEYETEEEACAFLYTEIMSMRDMWEHPSPGRPT